MMQARPLAISGIRAAIIDLDGTMLDTAGDFHSALNSMRSDLSLPPISVETILNFVGKGTENLIRNVLSLDFHAEDIERHFAQALASYSHHYQAINGAYSTIYPLVTDGLTALQTKGIRLACVTNKPYAFAAPLLEKKGLHRYFELIYGGDSWPHKKPDPLPLLKACEAFNIPPRQVVAIGDSSNDALAARAAGCWVLTVPYGYNHGQSIQEVDSDGIVNTLLDAAQVISS